MTNHLGLQRDHRHVYQTLKTNEERQKVEAELDNQQVCIGLGTELEIQEAKLSLRYIRPYTASQAHSIGLYSIYSTLINDCC